MSIEDCLRAFLSHKKKLEEESVLVDYEELDGFGKEFYSLRAKSTEYKTNKTFPTTEGEKHYNYKKNRYKDILPFDHTRVKLSLTDGIPGSDYINANFIKGANGKPCYIASQGPHAATVNDFWRMIWEQKTRVIIMACNVVEAAKIKCQKYWPDEDELTFEDITVSLVEEKDTMDHDYLVRHLKAEKGGESRLIYHLHYTKWPDHGVPNSALPALDLVAMAREYQEAEYPPFVVHCSAGCGRTGAIITIDYTWSMLKLRKLKEDFNLYDIIADMRTQRHAIVQTYDQYYFVHEAVGHLFEQYLELLDQNSYEYTELGQDLMLPEPLPNVDHEYSPVVLSESAKTHSEFRNRFLNYLFNDTKPLYIGGLNETTNGNSTKEQHTYYNLIGGFDNQKPSRKAIEKTFGVLLRPESRSREMSPALAPSSKAAHARETTSPNKTSPKPLVSPKPRARLDEPLVDLSLPTQTSAEKHFTFDSLSSSSQDMGRSVTSSASTQPETTMTSKVATNMTSSSCQPLNNAGSHINNSKQPETDSSGTSDTKRTVFPKDNKPQSDSTAQNSGFNQSMAVNKSVDSTDSGQKHFGVRSRDPIYSEIGGFNETEAGQTCESAVTAGRPYSLEMIENDNYAGDQRDNRLSSSDNSSLYSYVRHDNLPSSSSSEPYPASPDISGYGHYSEVGSPAAVPESQAEYAAVNYRGYDENDDDSEEGPPLVPRKTAGAYQFSDSAKTDTASTDANKDSYHPSRSNAIKGLFAHMDKFNLLGRNQHEPSLPLKYDGSPAQVIFKGKNISFPNRVNRPKGTREESR